MPINLILGIAFGLLVAICSYKLNLLNKSGTITTFFLSVIIFSFGQFKWAFPIVIFFIFSSLISKVRKRINPSADFFAQRNDKRDHVQVLANGGIPGMLILVNQFYVSEQIYFAYVSAIAAVCSDTWSTETGTMFKTRTFNILNFKKIEQGLSGGVSIKGFVGAVFGSFLIVISAIPWIENTSIAIFIIFISGIMGSLFDSILGSALQAKYKCAICNSTCESSIHCDQKTSLTSGMRWITNDTVNFAASLFGCLFSILMFQLFK